MILTSVEARPLAEGEIRIICGTKRATNGLARAMNLRLKRAIDQYVGLPALVGLNLVALGLGLVLRRSHSTGPVRTVVVIKFQGMGSLILAKPAFNALRKSYPDARLIFWGTPSTCVLARSMPEFDEVLTLDDRGFVRAGLSMVRGIVRLARRRVDWTFDLEVYSKLSSILATLTCARNRAGFAVDSVRARRWSHTHLVFFNRYEFLGRAYGRLLGLVSPETEQAQDDYGEWKTSLARLPELPSTTTGSMDELLSISSVSNSLPKLPAVYFAYT